jgi:GMP synthase-like glutamine amidotransferase
MLKIAILKADHIPESRWQYSGGDYPEMIKKFFIPTGQDINFSSFDVINKQYPLEFSEIDCFIITGSRANLCDNKDWINELKVRILEYYKLRKKIIGICFGHQLLAELFGGKVEKSKQGLNIGIQTVVFDQKLDWMTPFQSSLNLSHCHKYIVSKLPTNSKAIAKNSLHDIAAFTMDDNVLGIQAHPEMLKNHCIYLEDKITNNDKNTLKNKAISKNNKCNKIEEVDYQIVAKWFMNFIIN